VPPKLFGGLFGGLSSYGSSILSSSGQFASAWSAGGFGLFDAGGYTGPGGVHEPRGVVHAGEVVWSQRDVARAGGPHVVDAMRLGVRGYASGGPVDPVRYRASHSTAGPAPANQNAGSRITINNYSSAKVESEETTDERGGRQTVFTISDAVGAAITQKGGNAARALEKQYGLRRRGISR
jgi:hypothetical protein